MFSRKQQTLFVYIMSDWDFINILKYHGMFTFQYIPQIGPQVINYEI